MRSIIGPGDFDGDGNVDVLAVDDGYRMLLYPGNGNGGWRTAVQVGSGWGTMSPVIAPGDFNGDGAVDVLARSSGVLYLYPGDGGGGWLPRVSVGTGWEPMTAMIGPGDFDGDGNADVLGRTAAGRAAALLRQRCRRLEADFADRYRLERVLGDHLTWRRPGRRRGVSYVEAHRRTARRQL